MLNEELVEKLNEKFDEYNAIVYNANSAIEQVETLLNQWNVNFPFFYVLEQSPHASPQAPIVEIQLTWKFYSQENCFRLMMRYYDSEKPFIDFRPAIKLKYYKNLTDFVKELDKSLQEEYKDYLK